MKKKVFVLTLSVAALVLLLLSLLAHDAVIPSSAGTDPISSSPGAAAFAAPAPADPHLAQAQGQNADTMAWLTVPGTNIDGPVQQADDNEYYLRRDELGQPSHQGCIYADYECDLSGAELSMNTILYGHTFTLPGQDPDLGFGQLSRYLDPDFARENSFIFLSVEDQMFTFQVISAGMAAADAEQTSILAAPSWEQQQELIRLANERNVLPEALKSVAGQKLLTLSTSTNDSDTRLIIVAQLINGGEE